MGPKYKKIYLDRVIVRIDLATPIDNLEKGLPKKITNIILKKFPLSEPQQVTEGTLQINTDGVKSAPTKKFTILNFHGKEREKTLSVSKDYVYIEYKKYMGYTNMKDEFLSILREFSIEYPNIQVSRFGLRYINIIELDEPNPTDWKEYISEKLLSTFQIPIEGDQLTRAFNTLSTVKDDVNITFQYGMHNPDYPAAIKKKIFILDIDASTQGAMNEAEVTTNIESFHEKITKYFEGSLKEKLILKMKNG